ncbi:hypothetical protein GYA37_01550 [candidate division WWE3 bacterium]|uniref:Uncharacterized protein n=1 Tax=candidate division WWE3 bacterium TaxID=2053526 RepID=A0A7X9E6Q5_UNCKA|nr:hypothetical protein [candidate division WWE3 bacterium]
MPFPIVFGIPEGTSKETLSELRKGIVSSIVTTMEVPTNWVHPLFVSDLLGEEPKEETEGSNTIYVRLDTAMLHGKTDADDLAVLITSDLAHVVQQTFGGKYEVEVFIGDLNIKWRTLLKPNMKSTET